MDCSVRERNKFSSSSVFVVMLRTPTPFETRCSTIFSGEEDSDKVAFVNRRNGRIEGVVTKKLRSNLVVKTSEGQQWRVSPAALQAA